MEKKGSSLGVKKGLPFAFLALYQLAVSLHHLHDSEVGGFYLDKLSAQQIPKRIEHIEILYTPKNILEKILKKIEKMMKITERNIVKVMQIQMMFMMKFLKDFFSFMMNFLWE